MNRTSSLSRKTTETNIQMELNLDGNGNYEIDTGCAFFDHMLTQIARHGLFDLKIKAKGDLEVDAHHLVEDTGIVLGCAIKEALGDKKGITRYGASCIPMDEALSRCVMDICNRSTCIFNVEYPTEKVNDVDLEVFCEFFVAVANNLGCALHIENFYGENSHHIIESCFKAFGRCLRQAVSIDERCANLLPSTKGAL